MPTRLRTRASAVHVSYQWLRTRISLIGTYLTSTRPDRSRKTHPAITPYAQRCVHRIPSLKFAKKFSLDVGFNVIRIIQPPDKKASYLKPCAPLKPPFASSGGSHDAT